MPTQFSNLKKESLFNQVAGSLPKTKEILEKLEQNLKIDTNDLPIFDLPENFDTRGKWPYCGSMWELRDQSRCGSCWAVAAASNMSDRVCIHSQGKDQRRVSFADVMECCSLGDSHGCEGGSEDAAFMFWVERGYVTGDTYENDPDWCKNYPFPPCAHHLGNPPYPDGLKLCNPPGYHFYPTPACNNKCDSDSDVNNYWKNIIKGKSYVLLKGEKMMMNEIYNNGPIVVAIDLWEDF